MKKTISLFVFLILCIYINIVYATDISVTLNKNVTEIKKGEELTVDVKVNDVSSEKGVDTLIATLNYDSNIFEKVEKSNISSQNDWNSPSFRADTGKIIIQRDEPMKSAGTVFSIKLKAKETAAFGDSVIKLLDINLSDGTENYFPANVETTICIKDVLGSNPDEDNNTNPTPTPTTTPTQLPTENPTSTPTVTPTTKPTQSDTESSTPTPTPAVTTKPTQATTSKPAQTTNNATKPTVLPKAGENSLLIIFIVLLLLTSILGYIKYKKYRKI